MSPAVVSNLGMAMTIVGTIRMTIAGEVAKHRAILVEVVDTARMKGRETRVRATKDKIVGMKATLRGARMEPADL